jgi:hypothetical protein
MSIHGIVSSIYMIQNPFTIISRFSFKKNTFLPLVSNKMTITQGTRKVYSSSTNKANNYSYSIFVQQMY